MQPRRPRIAYRRPVRLSPIAGGDSLSGMAADLSSGGMFVEGNWQLPVGTQVDVKLESKWRDLPLARARVAWQSQPEHPTGQGVGLEFVQFALPRAEEVLRQHIGPLPAAPPQPAADPAPKGRLSWLWDALRALVALLRRTVRAA